MLSRQTISLRLRLSYRYSRRLPNIGLNLKTNSLIYLYKLEQALGKYTNHEEPQRWRKKMILDQDPPSILTL